MDDRGVRSQVFQGREKVWWMIEASGHRCSRVERRSGGWLRCQVAGVPG